MKNLKDYLYKKESEKLIHFNKTYISREELEAVLESLLEDKITNEAILEKFEKNFCEVLDFKKAIAVNSRTSAYHLVFLSLDIHSENTVWMSSLSSIHILDAARYMGINIRLIDNGKNSFHPDLEQLNNLVEKEMKENDIFIADYVYGSYFSFPFEKLKEKNIKIIEDITGILGYQINQNDNFLHSIGKYSEIQICGLDAEDIITTGKGAMILTNSTKIYKNITEKCYGKQRNIEKIAYDYLLEDFQCAMGIHQLNKIGQMLNRRKKIGQKYLEGLKNTNHATYFDNLVFDNYHKFPIVFQRPQEEVIRHYKSLKIEVSLIPLPLHKYLNLSPLDFPNAERLFKKSITLPVYPILTAGNVERIINSTRYLI